MTRTQYNAIIVGNQVQKRSACLASKLTDDSEKMLSNEYNLAVSFGGKQWHGH
jgi:hypothetical protein